MSESESLQTCRLYEFGVFHLDVNEGLFAGGEPVKLAPKVLQTLTLFVENPGRIITKDEFFDKIWTDSFVEDGALSFNISRLRKALGEFDKDTEFIETVSKRGFRFLADVRKVQPEESTLKILIERREVRELVREEEYLTETQPQPKVIAPARSRVKTAAFAVVTALMVVVVTALVLQRRENNQLKSFSSLQSTNRVSWKSSGSSLYEGYSSSHSGNRVAYSSTEDGKPQGIYVVQLTSGAAISITNDQWSNFSPVWSPDDEQIAFISVRESFSGIYLSPSQGGTPPKIVGEIGRGNPSLRGWSRDGSAIFYELEGNLFQIGIADGVTSQITDFPPMNTFRRHFAISRNEDQISFCDITDGQRDLWTKPLKGGIAVRLTDSKDEEYRSSWHPDGRRIVYTVSRDGHYQIGVAYIDGSTPGQITQGDGKYELIDISSDGKKIFYLKSQGRSDIWSAKTVNGEETIFTAEPESEFWPDISPDGRSIAYETNSAEYAPEEMNRSEVIVKDLGDQSVRQAFYGYDHKWLPDNRRIVFLRWHEAAGKYDLWLFDTQTGTEKQITFDGAAPPSIALFPYHRFQSTVFDWSPNADRIVYLDNWKRNVRITSLDDGKTTDLTGNTDTRTNFFCPMWSADGKLLAYMSLSRPADSKESITWRVWIWDGEIQREIFKTSKSLRFLGWTGPSNELIFETADGPMKAGTNVEIITISLTGEIKALGSFKDISALSMAVSPDRQNVGFVGRSEGKDNIYTASISGVGLKKVTSNSDSGTRFGSLRWSPDGKTIFFDKQEEFNVISMFQNFE